MAFTFDSTNPVNRDKVRVLIKDTVTPGHLLTDAEIDMLLTIAEDEIFLAARHACLALASKFSDKESSYSLPNGISVSKAAQSGIYLQMAEEFKTLHQEQQGLFFDMSNYDYSVDAFGRDTTEYRGD